MFIRFQAAAPDGRGRFGGVFSLVNQLAKQGRLTAEQERCRRTMNDWYDAACPDPCLSHPDTYDRRINPGAAAWFRDAATHMIDRVHGYLLILDAHGLAYQRLQSADPGHIIYQDPTRWSPCRTTKRADRHAERGEAAPATTERVDRDGLRHRPCHRPNPVSDREQSNSPARHPG